MIGDNAEVARYSGVDVGRTRLVLFVGVVARRRAGRDPLRRPARHGARRHGHGFELEIITIVLLGGVSIFGGSGRMSGVVLAVLIVLNLRNGFGLANVGGNTQTGVIGAILIGSVLAQNLIERRQRPAPRPRRGRSAGMQLADDRTRPARRLMTAPTSLNQPQSNQHQEENQ